MTDIPDARLRELDPKLVRYVAMLRAACAYNGPCAHNGDGCTCSASELNERHLRSSEALAARSVPERDDIAEVLFDQRQTGYRWADALNADGESDEGQLVSIVRDDAEAVLRLLAASPTGADNAQVAPAGSMAGRVSDGWRCFHCDEVFTDEQSARAHFGFDQASDPACRIKAGAEGSLVKALRAAESAAASAIHMVQNQSTEGFKVYYAWQSRSNLAIKVAEEAGYERGLADGRALTLDQLPDWLKQKVEDWSNTP